MLSRCIPEASGVYEHRENIISGELYDFIDICHDVFYGFQPIVCTFYPLKLILAVKFTIEEIFSKFWDLFNLFLIFGSKHASGRGGPSLIFAYFNASRMLRDCFMKASAIHSRRLFM